VSGLLETDYPDARQEFPKTFDRSVSGNSDIGLGRTFFSPGKACPERQRGELDAGDVGFIVDAAGCSQAENKPLEAR